jgi:hypothetical protein
MAWSLFRVQIAERQAQSLVRNIDNANIGLIHVNVAPIGWPTGSPSLLAPEAYLVRVLRGVFGL